MPPDVDEKELAIAEIYARSLFELAREREAAEELGEEIDSLIETLDREPDFERFVASPAVDAEAKKAVIESALRGRMSDLLVDGLQVMNRKGRLPLMRALGESYETLLEELRGEIEVEVATPVALSDGQRERLIAAASRFSGRTAKLHETVDASLLAGLVLRVGDRKVDTSAARELERLEKRLLKRASTEINERREYFNDAEAGA